MKICILLGGASPERHVSYETAKSIGSSLKSLGHEMRYCDPALPFADRHSIQDKMDNNDISDDDFKASYLLNENELPTYIQWMKHKKFDIIFNAMHGGNGENGSIVAHFELAGIAFTGSGSAASALAMDKYRSKILFQGAGIPTADFELCQVPANYPEKIQYPLVIKPSRTGSSVGLNIVMEKKSIFEECREALFYDNEIIIESYIAGRELTVAIVAGKAQPVVEIEPKSGVYDYESKYEEGGSQYYVPASISEKATDKIQELALKVYDLLGLQNYARIDFRMDKNEKFYCLEANTLPGMTSTSLLPKSLKSKGVEFPELLEMIIEDALKLRT